MAGIDINTTSGGAALLPHEVSSDIWAQIIEDSAVMKLAEETKLPPGGQAVPVVTGEAEAYWTEQTDEITPSRSTFTTKMIQPYKLAVLEPFSNEFKKDLKGLYEELRRRAPKAIQTAFDKTIFGSSAPGSNFDVLGGVSAVALGPHASDVKKGSYSGLVAADQAIAVAGGDLNGWVASPQMRGLLLNQVDTTGRPLIGLGIQKGASVPTLLDQPVHRSKGVYAAGSPATIGFAGDWESARWGYVTGIDIAVTEHASITDGTVEIETSEEGVTVEIPNQVNLFQRDMFALRITARVGFRVRDTARFVKLTNGTIS